MFRRLINWWWPKKESPNYEFIHFLIEQTLDEDRRWLGHNRVAQCLIKRYQGIIETGEYPEDISQFRRDNKLDFNMNYNWHPKEHYPTWEENFAALDESKRTGKFAGILKSQMQLKESFERIPVMVKRLAGKDDYVYAVYWLHKSLKKFRYTYRSDNSDTPERLCIESDDSPEHALSFCEDAQYCRNFPILVVDEDGNVVGREEWPT